MPPSFAKCICYALISTCLGSAPSLACTASGQLADLGQTYETLLNADSQDKWSLQANRLSDTLASTSAAELGRDLSDEGAPADITRIARLFADASSLLNGTWNDRTRHRARTLENLTYIDRMLTAAGCDEALKTASQTAKTDEPNADNTTARNQKTNRSTSAAAFLFWALALLALPLAGAAFYTATRSGVLKRRTKRRTRYPAVIPVLVTAKDGAPEVADTADISLGGVKLSWENAPPPGTAFNVDFGEIERTAKIIWSNAFFAGARFDTELTDENLDSIRNRNNNP